MKSGHFDLSRAGDACRRLNPQEFSQPHAAPAAEPAKRIRQDKPENELEKEYHAILAARFHGYRIYAQAIRLQLANGLWYKPDIVIPELEEAWEVKGPHIFRGGPENLKMAAREHPWLRFTLVWKDKATGQWQEQVILP